MTDRYIPGEMSRQYERLSPLQRSEVNRKVDEIFQRQTGIVRKLDPNRPTDMVHVREWLRIRDQIMSQGLGQQAAVATATRLPAAMQPHADEMRKILEEEKGEYWKEFEETVAHNAALFASLLTILESGLDAADACRRIAELWVNMRSWGCTSYDILRGIQVIVTEGRNEMPIVIKVINVFSAPTSRLTKMGHIFKRAGQFAEVAHSIIVSAIAFRREDYEVIAAEAYRLTIKLALPFTSVIDAMQEWLSAIWPGSNSHRFFKYVRAINPVALGGIAVDTVSTLIHCWVEKRGDPGRLERLVPRMREAGAGVFVQMGEDLGDALYTLASMSDAEFHETVNVKNFAAWLKSFAE